MSNSLVADLRRMMASAWASDERFFQRWPERQHRVRRAFPGEIELAQHIGVFNAPIPDDLRVFIGVRPSGFSRKTLGFLPPDTETDLDEADAERVFQILAHHNNETLTAHAALSRAAPSSSNGGVA